MMLSAMCLLVSYMKKQFKGIKYLSLGEVTWRKYFHQITQTGKKWNNINLLLQNKREMVPPHCALSSGNAAGQVARTADSDGNSLFRKLPPSSRPLSIPSDFPEEEHRRSE